MSRENLEKVREIFKDWERGDYSSIDWADTEIEFSAPGGLDTGPVHGIEAMGARWADWLSQFEEFETHAVEYLESGDQVLVMTRFSGRGKGSGVPVGELAGATLFRFHQGAVVALAIYTDPELALRDAGIGR